MMKKLFLLVALAFSIQMRAAILVVQTTNNTQKLHDITLIGKCIYADGDLVLLDKSGNVLASESITNIKKIVFSPSGGSSVDDVPTNSILVYPNPTQDVLFLVGITEQALRVYDVQGRLLKVENGTQITVGDLPTGTYLLQVGTQVVRFIKQ